MTVDMEQRVQEERMLAMDELESLLVGDAETLGCLEVLGQLDVTKRRQDQVSASGARRSSSEAPLVFRVGPAEAADQLVAVLQGISTALMLERTGHAVLWSARGELVAVVHALLPDIERHPMAEAWKKGLKAAHDRAVRLIDLPPERQFIGRCGARVPGSAESCPVELWPTMGEATIACPGCGVAWSVEDRTQRARLRVSRWAAPLPRVVEMMRLLGEKVTYEQARKWTRRPGKHGRPILVMAGTDASGTRLYRLGDVQVALAKMRKQEKRAH